jgi:NAD(P)-dependent dehydrogenase (short-subunit alcohol dehydrogenase family)
MIMTSSIDSFFRLDGRIALVTGARRGIGFAIATRLAEMGATVVLADSAADVADAAQALSAQGYAATSTVFDVTDRKGVDAAIDDVVATHGAIDILVANAGIAYEADSATHSDEDWRRVMAINLDGVFFVIRHVGTHMIRQKRGAIVAISSISGVKYVQPEHHLGYDVTKAGVAHMCKVLGCEWAQHHVRVNAVGPGYTDTELLANVGRAHPEVMKRWLDDIPMGRLMDPREIANAVTFLASDAASGITGHLLMVDGGYSVS